MNDGNGGIKKSPKKGAKKKTSNRRPPRLKAAECYAWDIRQGKITACEWVKLAVKRYFNDLKAAETKKFPYYFDRDAAISAIKFFDFLRHSKGEWAGQVFRFEDWESFIVWNLFGWRNKKTGFRRFRTSFLEVARKNGKTTLAAGIGNYMFDGDGEQGSEVYAFANKLDQAKIVHSEASRMIKSSPMLRNRIGIHVNNLHNLETNSKFEPLGRDYSSMDGLNTHCGIGDEVHAMKTREIYDIIDTSTGARTQSLIFLITTAGFNKQSICFELHDYTQKILECTIIDDEFFGIIYTLDEGDDWQDEKNWIKSNPNIGISAKWDDLRRKAKRAVSVPSAMNSFLRLHLNIWTESETRWISADVWNACDYPVEPDGLRGRELYGGLDLSSNKDLSAFALVCPPLTADDRYQVIMRFWIPQDNIVERVRRDRVPYDVWVRLGYITATAGNVIDYKEILHEIDELAQKYDIREIAFDRWGATKVIQDLQDMGFEKPADNKGAARHLIDFGQGYKSMSPPTKELENLILQKKIAHGGNPVLAWMASNVVIQEDPAGNIKPDKAKSTEKIDGVVALVMALDRALKEDIFESIYKTKEVFAI